ncbi:MAG TPA: hypothetical protein VHO25_17380 [Polyangiaceae bacterium]|nr:hypothetical protein [Polyangiaceae bacterium]
MIARLTRNQLVSRLVLLSATLGISAAAETQYHSGAECRYVSGANDLSTNPSPPGSLENRGTGGSGSVQVICPIRAVDAMSTPTEVVVTVDDNTDTDTIDLWLKCRDTDSDTVYSDPQTSDNGTSVDVDFDFTEFSTDPFDEGACFIYADIPPHDEDYSRILRYYFVEPS